MASIKGVNRSALVALAPDASYMATGTMAGAMDLLFSSSARSSSLISSLTIGSCRSSERRKAPSDSTG